MNGDALSSLLRLLQEHPSDVHIVDGCLCILLRYSSSLSLEESLKQQKSKLRKLLVQILKSPTAPLSRMEMIFEILFRTSILYVSNLDQRPESWSITTFLLATWHSRDISKRWLAFLMLQQFFDVNQVGEIEPVDSSRIKNFLKRGIENDLPSEMMDALGIHESSSELKLSIETWQTRNWALEQVIKHSNFYDVGVKLADLIVRGGRLVEFSRESLPRYQVPNVVDNWDTKPLTDFIDILPICARFVTKRRPGDEKHFEMANILMLYWFYHASYEGPARQQVAHSIEMSPKQAFFYVYQAQLCPPDSEDCFRASKRGLQVCSEGNASEYVESSLRFMAGDSAFWIGHGIMLRALHDSTQVDEEEQNRGWGQGVAFWKSALSDFELLINNAPPDSRYIQQALFRYINILYMLKGNEASKEIEVGFT